jgi:outer membrane protein, multidrug efflux system
MRRFTLLAASAALAGCSMTPDYVRPAAPVPMPWPVGDAYLAQTEADLPALNWRDVFRDGRLQQLVELALVENRDLREAAANVAAARANYRIQRAARFPVIGVGADASRSGSDVGGSGNDFAVNLGVTAFELDLFGRVAALSAAERERFFATEAGARAVRLALIGDIAEAWATHAADASLLRIAEQTVESAERSVTLTRARLEGGIAPRTDLRQAEQVLATALADVAAQRTAVAQDVNALQLLVGAPIEPALLPQAIEEIDAAIVAPPAGLSSEVLLRRPDVVAAEYELRAANADIGAARAVLFPRISLTGLVGLASTALGNLFSGGSFFWSAGAAADYPIFSGGAARAGVELSEAQSAAALAAYERAIQTAFREVADALARQGTIGDELAANQRLVAAAEDAAMLTDARYRGGIDTFLASLDAQRSLYAARRTLVATQQQRSSNAAALFRSLGVQLD